MNDREYMVREIVSRYFLLYPGEEIENVSVGEGEKLTVVNTTYQMFTVTPVYEWIELFISHAYDLYEVGYSVMGRLGPDPGVAVLPDRRMFYLNDGDQFCAFFLAVRDTLPPLELAWLLVRYRCSNEWPERLVADPGDLAALIGEPLLRTLPISAPEVRARSDGSMTLSFFTYFFYRRDVDEPDEVGLNRWQVEVDPQGRITCAQEHIAEGLDFAPKLAARNRK